MRGNKKTEDELVALICLKKVCESNFCVSKCCLESEIFVHTEDLCYPAKEMEPFLGKLQEIPKQNA